ncbi:MAG: BrnT family toxin [Rhizobiales bacterium]|nr:BrnT family toxin [Hyphomicrobiales bacterium]
MEFEWDEDKRAETIKNRGVDLLYVAQIFNNPTLVKRDDRMDYGEKRFIALGHVEEEYFILVYTPIEDKVFRLITAWKAGRNGEKKYKAHFFK